tara:strand:- start:1143 stop:1754 length:612 start_codon:yes stop_codon:yes gene_type:complete
MSEGRWRDIYDFWFGAPGTSAHGTVRDMWFGGGPELDAEIGRRFAADHARAAAGEFGDWKGARESCMALVVLLDQFPRNMYRGAARAFATDAQALETARHIVSGPMHDTLLTVEKVFAYLPFEHSEDLADQERCVALFRAMEPHDAKQEWLDYAVEHRDIVRRFGRFPHRNDILGRESTAEEKAWLASTHQRFGTVSGGDAEP